MSQVDVQPSCLLQVMVTFCDVSFTEEKPHKEADSKLHVKGTVLTAKKKEIRIAIILRNRKISEQ